LNAFSSVFTRTSAEEDETTSCTTEESIEVSACATLADAAAVVPAELPKTKDEL